MDSNQQEKDQEKVYDLQQYWLLVKRRWLMMIAVTGSVVGLTALATYQQKPVYQAEGKLLFETPDSVSKVTELGDKSGGGQQQNSVATLSNPLDTQAEVIRSNPIVQKTINDLELKDRQGKPLEIEDFLKKLSIKNVNGTDVLAVSYKSTNPQEAAAVVNSLTRNYLQNNILTKRSQVKATREFLSKELPEVEQRVTSAEIAVREFKEKNDVVSLEEESKTGVESLKDISTEITRTQANLTDARTRHRALQNLLKLNSSEAVTYSNLSQSSGVEQLLTEYQKVQDQLAVDRTRLTDKNPAIINMLDKQKALKKQLQMRVAELEGNSQTVSGANLQLGKIKQTLGEDLVKSEAEQLAQANRLASLREEFLIHKERLKILPKVEQRLRQLERRLQVAQITYQELQKRFQEVLVIENQTIGNARVIAEALVPKKPVSPKIILNLLLGGFLGILLGVGTAFILEALDKSLKTVEEAKQLLGYPLLGSIPQVDEKAKGSRAAMRQELTVLNNRFSPVNGAFERLQTSLSFTLSDKTLKVVVVTSAVKDEGKSYIAANLAVATAQMGRHVLLVDANMRHPRQQDIWQIPNSIGLSNVLIGQAQLQTTAREALANLEVLTSGTISPNPVALLDSQRIAALIQEASTDYDFVIIDTPALNVFADAILLDKLADGTLLVVRPGVINSTEANAAKTLLEQARTHVLGMVMNGVTNESSYGAYQSYYTKERNDFNKPETIPSSTFSSSFPWNRTDDSN
jgi:capsular exopolysaccharide synthesis family protein